MKTIISPEINTLIVEHNSGFFSNCTIHLEHIFLFFNKYKRIPEYIDSTKQFMWYKPDDKINQDIKNCYFSTNSECILYNKDVCLIDNDKLIDNLWLNQQFSNYNDINYIDVVPFINKYFSPSPEIIGLIQGMVDKYSIDFNNTCVLFYRGNDKCLEMKLPDYSVYIVEAKSILEKNPNVRFLIQSDETEFLDFFKEMFPNSVIFYDEIRHMNKCTSTLDHVFSKTNHISSKYYLSITFIMSKCQHIICNSGNCSLWIMLFRGNSSGLTQIPYIPINYHNSQTIY